MMLMSLGVVILASLHCLIPEDLILQSAGQGSQLTRPRSGPGVNFVSSLGEKKVSFQGGRAGRTFVSCASAWTLQDCSAR